MPGSSNKPPQFNYGSLKNIVSNKPIGKININQPVSGRAQTGPGLKFCPNGGRYIPATERRGQAKRVKCGCGACAPPSGPFRFSEADLGYRFVE